MKRTHTRFPRKFFSGLVLILIIGTLCGVLGNVWLTSAVGRRFTALVSQTIKSPFFVQQDSSGANKNAAHTATQAYPATPAIFTAGPMTSERAVVSSAAPNFGTATNFGVGTSPVGVAVGDFNLDGNPDLAVANNSSSNVSVLLGNGAGSFGAATNFGVGSSPVGVAIGDFNLDGKPDLAVTNASFVAGTVTVLLGNGAGGFGAGTPFAVGTAPRSVAVGDFNLDGKPDLAVANNNTNNVSVLLGNGTGGFGTATSFAVGNSPRSVAVGDFNLDGKLDLVTANNSSNNVSVLLGNGSGSFGAATNFSIGTSPAWVAVGDFNLDGKPDLATANNAASSVSVLLGDGTGSFGTPASFSVGSGPQSVAVGDFNLDGNPDLAAPNFSLGTLSVLPGDGTGSFGTATNFGVGNIPQGVAVGDFNLDGKPDLAVTNQGSNNVSVLLNCPTITATVSGSPTICAGDMATVTVTVTGGAPPYTVTLTNGGGTQTGTSPLNFTVSPSGTTTYAVQSVTAANACNVMGSGSATVTVNSLPGTPTITPTSASVCPSSAGNQAVGPAGATSYAWSITNGTITSATNLQNITYTAGASGTVGLMLTVTNASGCAASNTANVAINTSGVFTVTNGNDSGAGSLRQTIADACPGSTITFSGVSTVTLTSGELVIDKNLTIDGGASGITINRLSGTSRLFNINTGTSSVTLNNLTMTNGAPGAAGGAINVASNCSLTANSCTFTNNDGGTFTGGAIAHLGGTGTLTIASCTFSTNTAAAGGGAIITDAATTTISDSTFNGNTTSAAGTGGGIRAQRGNVTITNCTVSGNTGGTGGGIRATSAALTSLSVVNTTITGNRATSTTGRGGGIAHNASAATVTLTNTLVTGNFSGAGTTASDLNGNFAAASSFNLIGVNTDLTGISNGSNNNQVGTAGTPIDPLIGGLASNGGPTQTHALLPGSVAINAGNNCVLTANGCGDGNPALATDQRGAGFNRQVGGTVDIGAFESRGFTMALNGGNNQAAIINTAFLNPLAVLVSSSFSEPVEGGLVTFTPPGSGASATLVTNPATINASGIASVTATANGTTGGPYTVTASANGASPTTSFSLTNTAPPMFTTCTTSQTVNAASGQCTASVSFAPAASGFPAPTITCKIGATTITSPYNFPVGTSNVVCTASNGLAPDATCGFTVTVNDNQNPTLTCPTNIVANTAPNSCAALVSYTTPTASDNCLGATVICSPASGSTFQKGVTTVTCTATDASSNTASCIFTVTVNDNQNPSLACPANITLNTAAGICTAVATYATPLPTDNCAGVTATCVPASGSTFQKGVTTVTCTATDASNNTASCSFTVTVSDNQNPTITCPSNQTATSLTGNPIPVTFPAPTAADNCSGMTTACVPASGSNFAVGTTTVTCTATDASNRTATCSFTVTVISCTSITCPTDVSAATTGNSATVNYSLPVPTGSCGTITCSPASGSTFNLGVTTVTCASSIGNQSCSFKVTVNRVSGSAFDPLACTGPGNTVQATLVISNNGTVNQTVADTTTFTNLKGVPGSCAITPNVGTCVVTSGNLTYSATLTPGQTVTISYLTQVSDLALTGQQVCTNNSVTFNGGNPLAFSVCDVVDCPVAGPGNLIPATAEASDQKAGSVLIYNVYTSGATSGNTQNTRINLTNTHPQLPAFVHLFFVAEGCAIADSYICLTANQTASFLASDLDPGTTGYLVAVAVNALGCPTNFNSLIGDEYVKFTSGHAANLAAEAFAALPGGLPACDGNSVTATLNFDGVSYNRTPATLALDNIGSRADGNDTLLILNRIGGNLGTGANTLGTVFGILYDDAENSLSFSVAGICQLRSSITNNFPRTTPRFESFIPAGRTGWLKVFNQTGSIGITGAAINFNPNAGASAGAFNQGHNLHHLTLNNTMVYAIPIFPPSC